MKNIRMIRFVSVRNVSGNGLLIFAAALILSLASCSKEEIDSDLQDDFLDMNSEAALQSKKASADTSIEIITFTATAMIAHCHGENIEFTGDIENRVSKTTDANGVIHYTRSFRTRGMTGTGKTTGTIYDVLGGAEMFAIKDAVFINGSLNLPASISESDLVIHQGTLVFQSRTDNTRVVARHIIRKVPGRETINKWICGGK